MMRRPPRSTLSLHDALPICPAIRTHGYADARTLRAGRRADTLSRKRRKFHENGTHTHRRCLRSEEHTSELQSRQYLVCRLLLEKTKLPLLLLTPLPFTPPSR